jgi:cell division protein FtsI (penicillin-binding protein 3)
MDPSQIWSIYQAVGFGQLSGSGITGESEGELKNYSEWNKLQHATIAYGYGLSTTTLQLARAYSVFANRGVLYPVSFIVQQEKPLGIRVMSAETAQAVLHMMQAVISAGGTGHRARMKAYSSAGKTGTSKKSIQGGYSDTDYVALFAGLAPFKQPKIVVVVMIDTPTQNGYAGGQVAAPVFANIAEGTLRLMNVVPDQINSNEGQMALAVGGVK